MKSSSQENGNSNHKALHYTTQKLQINFYNNLEFFRTYNTALFNALQNAPQEYNLHVDSHGFNIIHLPTQKMHYPLLTEDMQSFLASDGKSVPQTSMLFMHEELARNPIHNPKWELFTNFHPTIESQFIDEGKLHLTGKHCNAMLKQSMQYGLAINDHLCTNHVASESNQILFMNLLQSFQDSKFLPQTIIYGLMGGIFLQHLLVQGYFFHSLMIYEENIDLFRISLYFLDYKELFAHVDKNSCFILIKDISEPLVRAFLQAKKITNNFLHLELKHYETQNVKYLKEFIFKEKKAIMRGWGSFEDESIGLKNAVLNLSKCNLLSKQPRRLNAPICVVGNGPSLDLCIDFIRANQNNMIIFSCGTALKVLRHHNIKPDFQIEIERVPYLADVLIEAGLEDIPLLFAQTMDHKALLLSKESYTFFRGGSASAYLCDDSYVMEFSAPFVGNAGVALATFLGSDCILCGIDCGYISGYSKHAKNSFYGQEQIEIPKDCFQVESNKDLDVFSNDLFYMSARNIEEAIKYYCPNHVVNLGYGAKIAGTLSLDANSFLLKDIDKKQELEKFKNLFVSYELVFARNEMCEILDEFFCEILDILHCDIQNLSEVIHICDLIFSLLQRYIMDSKKRKSIILIEGSLLHLSFSFLLSCLFAGNQETYGKIKVFFKHGIEEIIYHCKQKIQEL